MEKIESYGPWKVKIDVESTKDYYKNEWSECDYIDLPKVDDIDLMSILSCKQRDFLENFGIDISKAIVEKINFEGYEIFMIRALFCGDLYGIPKDKEEFYFDTEDGGPIFPLEVKSKIDISESEELLVERDHMLISFAHPILFLSLHVENEDDIDAKYKKWFCGKVFLKVVIKQKCV